MYSHLEVYPHHSLPQEGSLHEGIKVGVMIQQYTCAKEMMRENHVLGGPGVTLKYRCTLGDVPTSAAWKGHHFEGVRGHTVPGWGRGRCCHTPTHTHTSIYIHTHTHLHTGVV